MIGDAQNVEMGIPYHWLHPIYVINLPQLCSLVSFPAGGLLGFLGDWERNDSKRYEKSPSPGRAFSFFEGRNPAHQKKATNSGVMQGKERQPSPEMGIPWFEIGPDSSVLLQELLCLEKERGGESPVFWRKR